MVSLSLFYFLLIMLGVAGVANVEHVFTAAIGHCLATFPVQSGNLLSSALFMVNEIKASRTATIVGYQAE